MELFSRFKKDYFNYLLAIILPALIMGLSIPVLRYLLGAKGYGNFSIWFNGVLICAAILSGWIMQSVLRFYPGSSNKSLFVRQALTIFYFTQLLFFLPVLFIVWYIKMDWTLAVLFVFALFIVSLQFLIMMVSQSGFLSKKNIYSETIRATSYMGCALVLLLLSGMNYLYALFISVIISYLLSVLYLYKQIRLSLENNVVAGLITESTRQLAKRFIKYGTPLSIWFALTYLTSYIDKLFILKNLGLESQGNYQAIFDFLSRSLVLIISPVTTSLFPILITEHKKGELSEIKKLIKKIILFEIAGFILVGTLYWWFGSNILLSILNIPKTREYELMGFVVITGTFVWQIAMVVHKFFELRLQSLFLLGMVTIAFLIQALFYIIFQKSTDPLLYPVGYLLSGLIYLFLVSFSQIVINSKYLPQKLTVS